MGVLTDRLDAMTLEVSGPGGQVTAELRNRAEVDLRFAPDAYRQYDERTLEQHLETLAKLLWAARTKAYYAALSLAFGTSITGEARPLTRRDQDFDAERDELVAEGRSADGLVSISVRGMRSWTVEIEPGTLRRLDEHEFADRVRAAAAVLIKDQYARVADLKRRIYAR
jgi:DNA-binding protein YbaB